MPTGMTPELNQAIARRAGQPGQPALGQTSPTAPTASPVPAPAPLPPSQASAPTDAQAVKMPKFEPQNRKDLITLALVEQLKNENKLDKEKAQLGAQPSPEPAQASAAPQAAPSTGGGGVQGFSLSPGFEQPMARNQMQGDYQAGNYSGLNNYGQGNQV